MVDLLKLIIKLIFLLPPLYLMLDIGGVILLIYGFWLFKRGDNRGKGVMIRSGILLVISTILLTFSVMFITGNR